MIDNLKQDNLEGTSKQYRNNENVNDLPNDKLGDHQQEASGLHVSEAFLSTNHNLNLTVTNVTLAKTVTKHRIKMLYIKLSNGSINVVHSTRI